MREKIDTVCTARIVEEDALVAQMVDRFLCWKLPEDFNLDAGISFIKPEDLYPHMDNTEPLWPVGTNLLDAGQATAMVRYLLGLED